MADRVRRVEPPLPDAGPEKDVKRQDSSTPVPPSSTQQVGRLPSITEDSGSAAAQGNTTDGETAAAAGGSRARAQAADETTTQLRDA